MKRFYTIKYGKKVGDIREEMIMVFLFYNLKLSFMRFCGIINNIKMSLNKGWYRRTETEFQELLYKVVFNKIMHTSNSKLAQ